MVDKKIGVGVGVMILKGNELLLGLRNDNPKTADSELHGEGTWTLPGGGVKYGESFENAGIREIKEETNLDADDLKVICVQNDKNEYAHFISVGMVANKFSGVIKAMEPGEIVKWEWFNLDNLPKSIFFPSKKTIDRYKDGLFYKE
jgi:ADP-ribose pyrophosphatase YjhB (NUDIX family)